LLVAIACHGRQANTFKLSWERERLNSVVVSCYAMEDEQTLLSFHEVVKSLDLKTSSTT
jgi:hypothetical protein